MVPDSDAAILEPVFAALHDPGRVGDIPLLAGDNLKELGLSRLRLLATLIELEDRFDIEFPPDAVDCFRIVGDIAVYIQSHAMPLDNGGADERPASARPQIEQPSPASDPLHPFWARLLRRVFGGTCLAAG